MQGVFGAKAALFKQVMDGSSQNRHRDISESESESDEFSEDDEILELEDDADDTLCVANDFQVKA